MNPAKKSNLTYLFEGRLTAGETRSAAGTRLGESLAKLDAANLATLTDEEIEAEIAAARADHRARQ